jgi:hypothetical protein
MGTEVDNARAIRQGSHTLPNGRMVTARWYHHEQRG